MGYSAEPGKILTVQVHMEAQMCGVSEARSMEQEVTISRKIASSGAFTTRRIAKLFTLVLCVAYFFAASPSNSHSKSTDTENSGTLEIVPYFGFDDYITFLFMNRYLLSSAKNAGMKINIKKDQTANLIFILRKNAVVSCKLSKAVRSDNSVI